MPNRILRDWTDSERVNVLDSEQERFFTRLIMKADDFGRFHGSPALLKAALFPLKLDAIREADISRWTAACAKAGLIVLYQVGLKLFVEIQGYGQRLKPGQKSKFPDLPGLAGKIPEVPAQGGGGVEGDISEAGGGRREATPALEIPPELPTEAEIVTFGETAGIPPDYCRRYHAKTSETHSWVTQHNRLVDWRKRLPRFWAEDKPSWGKPRSNGKVKADINAPDFQPW